MVSIKTGKLTKQLKLTMFASTPNPRFREIGTELVCQGLRALFLLSYMPRKTPRS